MVSSFGSLLRSPRQAAQLTIEELNSGYAVPRLVSAVCRTAAHRI